MNFFRTPISCDEFLWCNPPPRMFHDMLLHLHNYGTRGVAVYQLWPSLPFYSKVVVRNHLSNFVVEYKDIFPHYISPPEARNATFKGVKQFRTLLLHFNFQCNMPFETNWRVSHCVLRGCQNCREG